MRRFYTIVTVLLLTAMGLPAAFCQNDKPAIDHRHSFRIGWGDMLYETMTFRPHLIGTWPATSALPDDYSHFETFDYGYTGHLFAEYQYRLTKVTSFGIQSDNNVKKISTYISKKVAEKLEQMFKENREEFEKKWDDLSIFLEYGSLTDEKFYDKIKDFYLLKNTEGKYFTIEEYRNMVSALQTDKNGNIVMLYAANADDQHVYIANAKEKGYDVVLMTGFLDTHFINMLEQKLEKVRFTRVDANVVDKLIEKEEDTHVSKLSDDQQKQLKEYFEKQVNAQMFTPEVASLSETDLPVTVTQNEFMRRFKDMEKVSGQQGFYGGFDHYNLVINGNHPLATRILDEKDDDKRTQLIQQMVDLAMLSQNILTGEKLSEFVKRSYEML